MENNMELILASQSPRRKQVLADRGYKFSVDVSHANEDSIHTEDVRDRVVQTAKLKAETVAKRHENAIILAIDTLVYFNGKEIGQQKTPESALHTLKSLLGKAHEVHSGIYMIKTSHGKIIQTLHNTEISKVVLRNVSDEVLSTYIHSGQYKGKAAAYNISDPEFKLFIDNVDGSYTNIMGMPIEKVELMLKKIQS